MREKDFGIIVVLEGFDAPQRLFRGLNILLQTCFVPARQGENGEVAKSFIDLSGVALVNPYHITASKMFADSPCMTTITSHYHPRACLKSRGGNEIASHMAGSLYDPKAAITKEVHCIFERTKPDPRPFELTTLLQT